MQGLPRAARAPRHCCPHITEEGRAPRGDTEHEPGFTVTSCPAPGPRALRPRYRAPSRELASAWRRIPELSVSSAGQEGPGDLLTCPHFVFSPHPPLQTTQAPP